MIADEKLFSYIESLEKLINVICSKIKAIERSVICLTIMLIIVLFITIIK